MSDPRNQRLRDRVERLAELDGDTQIFGATMHGWRLGPPLSTEELRMLEAAAGTTFPEDYRAFLTEVARAGAGPYYGLLDPMEQPSAELAGAFVGDAPAEDETVMKDPSRLSGCVVLADHGCGYKSLLSLAGPRRGAVFADLREALGGFHLESASFLEWYEEWLDRSVVELGRRRAAPAPRRAGAHRSAAQRPRGRCAAPGTKAR